jgi:diguanylate cyclase (GGDEF)-like protein
MNLDAIIHRLLTNDRRQRIRLVQVGIVAVVALASAVVVAYMAWVNIIDGRLAIWWTMLPLVGFSTVFLVIRSGANLRFADPSLTIAQMTLGFVCCITAYAIAGPGRGAVFPVLTVIIMFGMFSLQPSAVLRMGLVAVAMFGTTMALLAYQHPQIYNPHVELGHFIMIAFMLPVVSMLAGRLSDLRARLHLQKTELSQAVERIHALASRDELTGLVNRRCVNEALEAERQRSHRSGQTFSVCVLDLDHFKRINDLFGHPGGDETLRAFAREANAALRTTDMLARWGGEEFLLLMPDTSGDFALAAVERLREHVSAQQLMVGDQRLSITFSAGVAEFAGMETLTQLIARADEAAYTAKNRGRNRVVFAHHELAMPSPAASSLASAPAPECHP